MIEAGQQWPAFLLSISEWRARFVVGQTARRRHEVSFKWPISMTAYLTKDRPRYDARYFLTSEVYAEREMDGDQPTNLWNIYRRADIFDNDYHEGKKDGILLDTVDTQQLLVFMAHKTMWEDIMDHSRKD